MIDIKNLNLILYENTKKLKLKFIVLIILILTVNNIFFQYGLINFIINMLIAILVVIKSRFSILSILAILANYPLISLAFQEYTGKSYGLLELSVHNFKLHYYEINLATSIFNCILVIFALFTDLNVNEQNNLNKKYSMSNFLKIIFCLIAIIATIIYLPRIPLINNLNEIDRYYHLLPGNAWNYVAIVAVLFTTLSRKLSLFQILTYIFVILWFFLNYERVDMLGLTVFLVFRYRHDVIDLDIIKRIKYKKTFFTMIMVSLFTFLFSSSYLREGKKFSFWSLIRDTLIQTTSCDIIHVFNTAFEYVDNIGKEYGATYLNYVYKIIPGFGNQFDYSNVLDNYIANPGGGYFLTEPYMNFGYFGIIIFSLLLLLFIYLINKYSNSYTYLLYACLLSASFRVMWYGLIYIHKSYLIIIPVLFLLMFVVDSKIIFFLKNRSKIKLLKEVQ